MLNTRYLTSNLFLYFLLSSVKCNKRKTMSNTRIFLHSIIGTLVLDNQLVSIIHVFGSGSFRRLSFKMAPSARATPTGLRFVLSLPKQLFLIWFQKTLSVYCVSLNQTLPENKSLREQFYDPVYGKGQKLIFFLPSLTELHSGCLKELLMFLYHPIIYTLFLLNRFLDFYCSDKYISCILLTNRVIIIITNIITIKWIMIIIGISRSIKY